MTPLEQYKAKKLEDFCKRFVVEKGGGRDGLGDPIPPYEELKEFDPAKYQDFRSQTIDELWALPEKKDAKTLIREQGLGIIMARDTRCFCNGWNSYQNEIIKFRVEKD